MKRLIDWDIGLAERLPKAVIPGGNAPAAPAEL